VEDEKLKEIAKKVVLGKAPGFRLDDDGIYGLEREYV
jgi:hypothetical protein